MREIGDCLVCNNAAFIELYHSTFDTTIHNASSTFLASRKHFAHGRIIRCAKCGFAFTDPQLEVEEYQQIYEDSGNQTEPLNDILLRAEEARGRRLAGILDKYANFNGKLFDFGCGQGGFLRAIDAKGKFGFEVTELAGHKSINAKILTGDFLSMTGEGILANNSFDIITAVDVLEHLPRLDIYLQALSKLARKDGALLVTVPNIDSFSAQFFRSYWGLLLLEHLWYFSPNTLNTFIESFGWRREEYGYIPYDVPVSHIASRLSQIFKMPLPGRMGFLGDIVIPVPVGLMYGVFRKL